MLGLDLHLEGWRQATWPRWLVCLWRSASGPSLAKPIWALPLNHFHHCLQVVAVDCLLGWTHNHLLGCDLRSPESIDLVSPKLSRFEERCLTNIQVHLVQCWSRLATVGQDCLNGHWTAAGCPESQVFSTAQWSAPGCAYSNAMVTLVCKYFDGHAAACKEQAVSQHSGDRVAVCVASCQDCPGPGGRWLARRCHSRRCRLLLRKRSRTWALVPLQGNSATHGSCDSDMAGAFVHSAVPGRRPKAVPFTAGKQILQHCTGACRTLLSGGLGASGPGGGARGSHEHLQPGCSRLAAGCQPCPHSWDGYPGQACRREDEGCPHRHGQAGTSSIMIS